ncbi:MAG: undecaprenyl-phosphate glucose phosphotransferase [Alphaproteobacteria bacterium]|nr:undecaprenyl-phosphate glucose phosphotransferase [Alphaproteobacteria bacterium]
MRRYALALFDSIRLALHAAAAGFSGWLAFVLYYAPDTFVPLENLLRFFEPASIQYGKLAVLAGIIFSAVSFMKYGRSTIGPFGLQLQRLIATWCITLLIVISILFLLKTGSDFSRGWMIVWALITPIFLIVIQRVERVVVATLRQVGFTRRRIAIVGATSQAARLLDHFGCDNVSEFFDLVGVFDDRSIETGPEGSIVAPRGSISELKKICRNEPIDAIVIALPSSDSRRISDTVERLMDVPADIFLSPDLVHFDLALRPSTHLGPIPVTNLTSLPMRDWAGIAKWIEDKSIVLIAAILLAPLLLLIALLIKLDSPGPVLFRQRRFGFNNRAFDLYKFRTMEVDQCDPSGARQTSRNDCRITRIGRILRRTSLDELPQLINVWLGDMSIVGPRAHPIGMMVADQPYHEMVHHYAARHRVKPGITGLAQVNGNRGEVTTRVKAEKRVSYDLFYIENWSIWLDFSIILRTVIKLPFDRSAY